MWKKILSCISFIVCLFFNSFLIFQTKVMADSLIEHEEILKDIEDTTTNIIKSKKEVVFANNIENIIKSSETAINYATVINVGNDFLDEDIKESLEMTKLCNSEINKRVKDYEAEQARIAEEKRKAQELADIKRQMQTRAGMIGRLLIPDVGVNVAVINVSCYDGRANQAVVDARDSAAWMADWGASVLIGDHNNQGFNAMKRAVPNKTKAYIKNGTTTKTYICVANFKGHNTGDITDNNFNSLRYSNAGGITMYTCNENSYNITITYWQPI